MIRVVVGILMICISLGSSAEDSLFYEVDGYIEYSTRGTTEYDESYQLGVGGTGGYFIREDWTVVGSVVYEVFSNEFDHAFAGVLYKDVLVTYGTQVIAYAMVSDRYSYIVKREGLLLLEDTYSVWYDDGYLSTGASITAVGGISTTVSIGANYKLSDTYSMWMAYLDTPTYNMRQVGGTYVHENISSSIVYEVTDKYEGDMLISTIDSIQLSSTYSATDDREVYMSVSPHISEFGIEYAAAVGLHEIVYPSISLTVEYEYSSYLGDAIELGIRYEY